jgi:cytochrome c-type biogenesis protein
MELSFNADLISSIMIVFLSGFVVSLGPCCLPSVIFVGAYVTGKKDISKWQSFLIALSFVAGMVIILTGFGLLAGELFSYFEQGGIFYYSVAAVLLIMGLWQMGVLEIHLPFTQKTENIKVKSQYLKAFIIGIPFGIIASGCTLPITFGILTYASAKGSAFIGALLMFSYSIGKSIPAILVGTFSGFLMKLKFVTKYYNIVQMAMGCILIVLALYFIWIA